MNNPANLTNTAENMKERPVKPLARATGLFAHTWPSPGEMILDKQTIRLDEYTGQIFQGTRPLLNLTPLERTLLRYFLANPQLFLTKSEIIVNSWPEDIQRQGVSDDALYQAICSLRRKLQHGSFYDCNYIRNWRGSRDRPEGGYRFFPDGQMGTWAETSNVSKTNQLSESETQQLLNELEHLIQKFKNGRGGS